MFFVLILCVGINVILFLFFKILFYSKIFMYIILNLNLIVYFKNKIDMF